MEKFDFDVFVIGTGSAGKQVATTCVEEGLKVAITDDKAYGGTCSIRGCDPKKVILTITEAIEATKRLEGKGISKAVSFSWTDIKKFKDSFTKDIPDQTEKDLKDAGIHLFHESPTFIGKQKLKMGDKEITVKNIVIATGMIPSELPFDGNDLLKTSRDFFEMEELPKSAVFIGAGYVGMEMAHILSILGCAVTVIDSGDKILSNFDKDVVDVLTKKSRDLGIVFELEAKVQKVENKQDSLLLTFENEGQKKEMRASVIFNTAGRVPAVEALDVEKASIETDKGGIVVNDYLQSTKNNNVYACGDVASHSLPLTPIAGIEGNLVAKNIINKEKTKIEIPHVPSTVFTTPPLASVGLSVEEAKDKFKAILVHEGDASKWFNAKRQNEEAYYYKIISDKKSGKIVGAHLVGPEASETINLLTIAINKEMTTQEFANTIFTYPTLSYDVKSMF